MFAMCRKSLLSLSVALATVSPAWSDDPGLGLMQAIEIARAGDPWLGWQSVHPGSAGG